MAIGQLPGRIGNFIQGAAQRTGEVAGNIGSELREGFGFGESNVPEDEQLYGVNPRRAYWAAALGDFSRMAAGQPFQGSAQETQQRQQLFQQQIKQRKAQQQIQLLNALKSSDRTPNIIREARELYPNDPAAQKEYVEDYRKKAGVEVNMGQDWQTQIMGNIMEARSGAVKAGQNVRRYNAMLELIPSLGNTGGGAEAMTTFRSTLNQFGLEELSSAVDAFGQVAGVDIFSGDQGARELFRALSNQDIISQARELYPVSNSDIQLLKQMAATLSGQSDSAAMEALIRERLVHEQNTLDQYEWLRGQLPPGITPPPSVPGGSMDLQGIGSKRQRLEELRRETGM